MSRQTASPQSIHWNQNLLFHINFVLSLVAGKSVILKKLAAATAIVVIIIGNSDKEEIYLQYPRDYVSDSFRVICTSSERGSLL